ncbi:MAG: glycosyltransferase [Candidatus Omnitrophica bacterium]|nr:glycosyltransferase [Candidatus Omnitrophota bacterium]
MKVLYISYDGATEPIPQSQILTYLRQINKNGIEFYWLSFEKPASPLRFAKRKKSFKAELLRNGINWFGLPYHKRPYLFAKIFDISNGIFHASYLISRHKISILHGRGEIPSFICMILKYIFKLHFIYDRRGYMAEDYVEGGMWKSRKSFLYRLLKFIDKKLLLSADAIVVLTERIRDILVKENIEISNRIHVIPCCVDLNKFKYNVTKDKGLLSELKLDGKFIFIYLGSLGTWYLIKEMIDFFIVAKTQIPDSHFLILTMSDHSIARDILYLKGQKETDFTILNSPPSLVQDYLSLADAALIFIKPVFSKLSSSPTKFAECLSCGLPVIINSNIGDCDKLIKSNRIGVIVDEFSNNNYQQALEELKSLMNRSEDFRQRCRKAAEDHYSLNLGVSRYSQIYKRLYCQKGAD